MGRSTLSIIMLLMLSWGAGTGSAGAQVTLHADEAVRATGLLEYILPRFSLKMRVRVEPAASEAEADMALVPRADGRAGVGAFTAPDGVPYILELQREDEETVKFRDWLTSEIGQRTVTAYQPESGPAFAAAKAAQRAAAIVEVEGDATLGEDLALLHCGRCHVVSARNRFAGIGSTPSFGAMKTIAGWRDKFAAFWTLNPHPAFTQVEGMTEPFPDHLPPAIVPLTLTLDEVQAIEAFVATLPVPDLGAAVVAR